MKKIILSIILFAFFIIKIHSQSLSPSVISPLGNFYNNSNASLSFTFGEPVIQTLVNNYNILTQGFQQPYFKIKSETEDTVIIYPNPTIGPLFIKGYINTNAILYNVLGQKISETQILTKNFIMDFSHYAQGVYFLKFYNLSWKKMKTYKIIKLKRMR